MGEKLEAEEESSSASIHPDALAHLIGSNPDFLARNPSLGRMMGITPEESGAIVKVAEVDVLRSAMEGHPALKWHERLETVCGKDGVVKKEDDSDGTCQVVFEKQGITAWLPQMALTYVSDPEESTAVEGDCDDDFFDGDTGSASENGSRKRKQEEVTENEDVATSNSDSKRIAREDNEIAEGETQK